MRRRPPSACQWSGTVRLWREQSPTTTRSSPLCGETWTAWRKSFTSSRKTTRRWDCSQHEISSVWISSDHLHLSSGSHESVLCHICLCFPPRALHRVQRVKRDHAKHRGTPFVSVTGVLQDSNITPMYTKKEPPTECVCLDTKVWCPGCRLEGHFWHVRHLIHCNYSVRIIEVQKLRQNWFVTEGRYMCPLNSACADAL